MILQKNMNKVNLENCPIDLNLQKFKRYRVLSKSKHQIKSDVKECITLPPLKFNDEINGKKKIISDYFQFKNIKDNTKKPKKRRNEELKSISTNKANIKLRNTKSEEVSCKSVNFSNKNDLSNRELNVSNTSRILDYKLEKNSVEKNSDSNYKETKSKNLKTTENIENLENYNKTETVFKNKVKKSLERNKKRKLYINCNPDKFKEKINRKHDYYFQNDQLKLNKLNFNVSTPENKNSTEFFSNKKLIEFKHLEQLYDKDSKYKEKILFLLKKNDEEDESEYYNNNSYKVVNGLTIKKNSIFHVIPPKFLF